MNKEETDNLQLEHVMGFNGKYLNSLKVRGEVEELIYPVGGMIVVEKSGNRL